MQALTEAIEIVGGPSRLAAALDAAPSAPYMWLQRGRVPERYRPGIEKATGGRVTVESFGDDVPWLRVRDKKWPHPAGRPLLDFGLVQ